MSNFKLRIEQAFEGKDVVTILENLYSDKGGVFSEKDIATMLFYYIMFFDQKVGE